MLKLVRRYLQSGIMEGGVTEQRTEGTPQGGPLSPLLSNILLNDLDKELERRGHRFCRYADDCNIYVKSRRAGERVMDSLKAFLEGKLRLKVNETKSQVARPWESKFLGYSMTVHRSPRLKVAGQSVERFKEKVRQLIRKGRGRNLERFIAEDLNPLVGQLLQESHDLRHLRGTRRMAVAQAALPDLAEVETGLHPSTPPDSLGVRGG